MTDDRRVKRDPRKKAANERAYRARRLAAGDKPVMVWMDETTQANLSILTHDRPIEHAIARAVSNQVLRDLTVKDKPTT